MVVRASEQVPLKRHGLPLADGPRCAQCNSTMRLDHFAPDARGNHVDAIFRCMSCGLREHVNIDD